MMSSSSAGAAGLSVGIGGHFPSTMCQPHSAGFILSHFPFQYILHDSTLEGCGTMRPLRSVAEYVVPHAMFL